ncbi:MAG: DUF3990 domain-containing protein [Oscillospiraceae bacterium]|nr:DUF3990 domain-containing protein [Oscillospiraceae bacterium]
MILYHGSYAAIEKPNISFSRLRTDYRGRGITMTANRTLVGHKCAGVIKTYAEMYNIPRRESFDIFYISELYYYIVNGISDMHAEAMAIWPKSFKWK